MNIGEGKEKIREVNHKTLLNTENKLRVAGGDTGGGDWLKGGWALRRTLVGMSTGCCM